MFRSAFNLQRHFKWTAEVDLHNPMKFCRLQPMLLGHRRKNSRSAGVAPTSSDLESEAHRYEYQDRIENRSLSSDATNLICTSSLASDVLRGVFLNDIRNIKTLCFEKMSEKDSNLHEVASSSGRGLIGVEPKHHWSTLRWCLNLSPYSSITQIGPYWKSHTYVATMDKWFTVIPRPLRD